jgi:dienelactone hydrolase
VGRKHAALVVAAAFCLTGCAQISGYETVKVSSLPESAFFDSRKPRLDLFLKKPNGPGPFPAIIYLHNCAGLDWRFADVAAKNYLTMGYAVAVVDSLGPRGLQNICGARAAGQNAGTAQRAWDAYAALDFLSRRPDIDSKHVFLHGESHGADTVIAALDESIERDTPLRFAGGIAYYPYCGNLRRVTRPLLILIGEKDDWTAAQLCRSAVGSMTEKDRENTRLVVYPSAYHGFNMRIPNTVYMGHQLGYDETATAQSLDEIARFLRVLK